MRNGTISVQASKNPTTPPTAQIRKAFKIWPLISCPKPGMKNEKIAGTP
jgi:hypothetical protein